MQNINFWESKFQLCQYSSKLLETIAAINIQIKTPININEIKKACYYAREYHGIQLRKSGQPYYSHPLEVGRLFSQYTGNQDPKYYTTDLVVAAILHDCLEDTALTTDMIEKIFNKSVADKVQDLTRTKGSIKNTAADTLHSLFTQNKTGVLYIKIFDRLHNMRTLDAMLPEKRRKISEETYDHFTPYSEYFELYEVHQEFIDLCSKHLSSIKPDLPEYQNLLPRHYHYTFQLLSQAFQSDIYQMQNP